METKIFEIKKYNEIPPKSKDEFHISKNISDWFFVKTITMGGEESKGVAFYCFDRNKWYVLQAGCEQVIEYYKEIL
jgi:hypothetical protein